MSAGQVPLGLLVDLNDPSPGLIQELCSTVENPFEIHEDDPFGLADMCKNHCESRSLENNNLHSYEAEDVDVLVQLSDSPRKPVASSTTSQKRCGSLDLLDEPQPGMACDILEDWDAIAQEAMHLAADFETKQLSPVKISDIVLHPDSPLLSSPKRFRDFLLSENVSDLENTTPPRFELTPKEEKDTAAAKRDEVKVKAKKDGPVNKRRSLEPRATKTSSKRASLAVPIKGTPLRKPQQREVKDVPDLPKTRTKPTTASATNNVKVPAIRKNLMNPPPNRMPITKPNASKSNGTHGPIKAAPLPADTSTTSIGSVSSVSTPSSVGSTSRMRFSGLPAAASTPSLPGLVTPSKLRQPLLRATSDLTNDTVVQSSSIHSLRSGQLTLNGSLGLGAARRSAIPSPAPRISAAHPSRIGSLRPRSTAATETKRVTEPTANTLPSVSKASFIKPKSVMQSNHKENVQP